jgi:hypothetical protein
VFTRVQEVFVTTRHLPDLTRRTPCFYSVVEEIVEGFVEGFLPSTAMRAVNRGFIRRIFCGE